MCYFTVHILGQSPYDTIQHFEASDNWIPTSSNFEMIFKIEHPRVKSDYKSTTVKVHAAHYDIKYPHITGIYG